MKKKLLSILMTVALVATMAVGCGSKEEPAQEPASAPATTETEAEAEAPESDLPGAGKTIAFVPKQLGNPYFVAVRDAVEEAALANGFEFKCNAPDSSIEVDKQVSICEAFVAEGVDVLIIIPNDSTAIVDVINSAAEKGIAVFIVDSGADESEYVSYIGTDNYAGGGVAGEWFKANITGKVAVIDGAAGNGATTARYNGFKDTLAGFDGIELVTAEYGNGDMGTAMSVAENLLVAYPDLAAIFCCDDIMAQGAGQAVAAAGKDVVVCGFDGSPEGSQAIIDGVMDLTIAQTPRVMGLKAVEYAIQHMNGEAVERVIYTDCEVVDANNAADYLEWH